jgi:hypothetical protein
MQLHLRGMAVLLSDTRTHSASRWGRERGRSIPFASVLMTRGEVRSQG